MPLTLGFWELWAKVWEALLHDPEVYDAIVMNFDIPISLLPLWCVLIQHPSSYSLLVAGTLLRVLTRLWPRYALWQDIQWQQNLE